MASFLLRYFCFGILGFMLFEGFGAKELRAQQPLLAAYDLCGGNRDCASYRGDFDQLVHEDRGLATPPGKRPENRSHILVQAGSYLQEHGREPEYGGYFRYLSCVSGALWSERGDNRTLFSAENIIETFFALAGRDGEKASGIQRACDLLGAYQSRLERVREEQSILQRRAEPQDPENVWHAVLVDEMRRQAPKRDAEAGVRRDQERYCLFAVQCRGAENSPFAGK